MKRIISIILIISFIFAALPVETALAAWTEPKTMEIKNNYIKVVVSQENGGFTISTVEGDILKKTDNHVALTHRGANMDTSFTSFRIDGKDYIFGNDYGFLGATSTFVKTERDPMGAWIKSTWSIKDVEIEQKITMMNSEVSEQLGTAMISYTVRNKGNAKSIKSRILMDTQLGDKDYGYYELPKQNLGQGYEYFEFERTWDKTLDPTIRMPADYFVRDNPFASDIVGFGVNSVFEDQKPYKMTFAHWANMAATKFDYEPDTSLNFTNNINKTKTADSAAALYYDLGTIGNGGEKTFSTYYGVTANLKNKDNKILINTTAPSKLEFTNSSNTAYKGSEKAVGENIVRINTTITNPNDSKADYKALAVVVYALGFKTQRQTDMGTWIPYDNNDPIYTDVVNLGKGQNRTTYFDFKFTPQANAQLGSFITKVYNMDEGVNDLGSYAEEYCLATTENFIILPGKNPQLPAITLAELGPKIIYNKDTRYITVTGNGMEFFRSDLLNKIELRGDNGKTYKIPIDNITFEQGEKPKSITLQLDEYMEVGRYELHFIWKSGTGQIALQGVPEDFTSSNMFVQLSSDPKYSNAHYGIVTVQRDKDKKYKVLPYKSEDALKDAKIKDEDLLLSFRGEIIQDKDNKNFYRMLGKDKDININHMLNYYGSDLTIEQKPDGSVSVLMDGKITTVGANTTVRKGTAAFKLKTGTEYIVPTYNEKGEIQDGGSLVVGQDYIQLTWSKTFDTLLSIGGFLIDLKYGVLGKIQNGDGSTYDIISFGGGLDLGFLTPGGAAKARENKKGGDSWTKETKVDKDDDPNGFGFGLDFDDDTGDIKVQTKEVDAEPKNSKPSRVEAGVEIHDVLYGGKKPGYIGINMEANATIPQIVSFLPNKIVLDLSVNTIGGYKVAFDGKVKTTTLEMELSLVIKSNPSGAPIPDKLYFTVGGIEPGINVDGAGVLWITGGGGGFDKLYDTIYGKSGIPPLTLMLHIEFDVTKILTGSADLELSLRSIAIKFDDLSLKKLEDAKFIDGGMVAIGWYPNFSFNFQAGVTYMQILKGSMQISAGAGGGTKAFFEFVLRVSLTLPKVIPIVGGMQLASAELGGGTEKVWGNITLLELIKVGFIYYWGGDVEFTAGNTSGTETMGMMPNGILLADAGELRSYALFSALTSPQEVGKDSETGESQFVSVGSNLSFVAGSKLASNFDELVAQANSSQIMMRGVAPTEILTNSERTSHLVKFGTDGDYILTVSAVDGRELNSQYLKDHMSIKQGDKSYDLNYYTAPGENATDIEKKDALKDANVNVAGGVAYIIIPKKNIETSNSFLIDFDDKKAYDVGAIEVEPISKLTSHKATLAVDKLTVNWAGENISDTAKIIVSISDIEGQDGVILNTDDILAKTSEATLTIPKGMSSGKYYVTLTLSDEEKCYERYEAGVITITNSSSPSAPQSVSLTNEGDDMLRVDIVPADVNDTKLKGYFIDVYENDILANAGLYFDKGEEILIGGRYSMPIMGEDGKPTEKSVIVGYTPGKTYSVKVRAVNIEERDKDIDGDEIYHCSSYINSDGVALKGSTPPVLNISYDKNTENAIITSNVPVKGELYINGDIKDGKWYRYEPMATTINQKLNLPDGEHLLEFHGVDSDGDHAIVQQMINIDTTPPMVMLESPTSGETFYGDTLQIKGVADSDANFIFKLNGVEVKPKDSNIFIEGFLDCEIPLDNVVKLDKINLEIIARDEANNKTTLNLELSNSRLAEINNISVYNENSKVQDGKLNLKKGKMAALRIMGTTTTGHTIDITDNPSTRFEVFGGNSANLAGSTVTGKSEGQTMIMAEYDLGGNRYLTDGVVVFVEDKEEPGKPEEPEKPEEPDPIPPDDYDPIIPPKPDKPKVDNKEEPKEPTPWENPFKDIKEGSWYYNAVRYVNEKGLMSGTAKDIFSPELPTTRGMIVTILHRLANKPKPKGDNTFTDVKEEQYYTEAVKWAVENNIVSGYGYGKFGPNDNITREQLGVMMMNYAKFMKYDISKRIELEFRDNDKISAWAKDALSWANAIGLIQGKGNNTLDPRGIATRAEVAAILERFIEGFNKE